MLSRRFVWPPCLYSESALNYDVCETVHHLFHLNHVTGRHQYRCIVRTEAVYTSKVILKMGELVARNMYSRFK